MRTRVSMFMLETTLLDWLTRWGSTMLIQISHNHRHKCTTFLPVLRRVLDFHLPLPRHFAQAHQGRTDLVKLPTLGIAALEALVSSLQTSCAVPPNAEQALGSMYIKTDRQGRLVHIFTSKYLLGKVEAEATCRRAVTRLVRGVVHWGFHEEKLDHHLHPILMAIFLAHDLALGEITGRVSCEVAFPNKVRTELENQFPGWEILEWHHLTTHQREVWKTGCPGIAIGNFTKQGARGYAVVLIREQARDKAAILVLVESNGSSYDMRTIREEKSPSSYPVVHTEPPGTYREFYDRQVTINTQLDGFVYEHLEATATLFYYKDGQLKELLISD